ncbi:MAG: hypothetical protein ACYTAO_22180, partial [Planctomycetota bacterium]
MSTVVERDDWLDAMSTLVEDAQPIPPRPVPPPAPQSLAPRAPVQQRQQAAEEPKWFTYNIEGRVYRYNAKDFTPDQAKHDMDYIVRDKIPLPIELRQRTPVDETAQTGYAELFGVEPEDVTPQLLKAAIEQRTQFADETEEEGGYDPVGLRQFRQQTAAMTRDLDRRWPDETTADYGIRRAGIPVALASQLIADAMEPERVLSLEDFSWGVYQPPRKKIKQVAKSPGQRRRLEKAKAAIAPIVEILQARTPEQIAEDEAIIWDRTVRDVEPERLERLTKVAELLSRTAPTGGVGEQVVASKIKPEDRELFQAALHRQYGLDQTMREAGYGARLGVSLIEGAFDRWMPAAKLFGAVPKLSPEQERFKQQLLGVREGTDPTIRPDTNFFAQALQKAARMTVPMVGAVGFGKGTGGIARMAGLAEKGQKLATGFGVAASFYPQIANQTYTSLIGEGVDPDEAFWITAASAPIEAGIESILPNPFAGYGAAFRGTARQVAGKLVRQYLINFGKENIEEGLQGITNETALEVGRMMDEKIPGKGLGNILVRGVEDMQESALPLALLMGPGAAVGGAQVARASTARAKRMELLDTARLRELPDKLSAGGTVSRKDAGAWRRVTGTTLPKGEGKRTQEVREALGLEPAKEAEGAIQERKTEEVPPREAPKTGEAVGPEVRDEGAEA